MGNQKIASALESKYQETFEILDEEGGWLSSKIAFIASPTANPTVKFKGSFTKKNGAISDSYRSEILGHVATEWTHKKLSEFYDLSAIKTDVRCRDKEGAIPDFDTLLETEADGIHVISRMYIFQSINEDNYDEALDGVYAILSYLHEHAVNKSVFDITFFDENEFKDFVPSEHNFGFNVLRDNDFEYSSLYKAREDRIMFKVASKSELPSKKELFEIRLAHIDKAEFHIF